jgi:CRISPR-associated protein Cas2
MTIHKAQTYLVAYDIGEPKRLVRVHRCCRQWGVPVQYSVFLVRSTPAKIGAFVVDLRGLIDERDDDVRIYPLPSRIEVEQYGRQGLPVGVTLVGDGTAGQDIAGLAARARVVGARAA